MSDTPADLVRLASGFWDDQLISQERRDANWMARPDVRDYINMLIGAGRPLWPLHWLLSEFPLKFSKGLSVGCGSGNFERSVIELNVCETVDAFDGAVHSLYVARKEAEARGWEKRLRFYAADFNAPVLLRGHYDIVFFNQSLHHVARLERVFAAVLRALKPGGVLFIDEYIGPSRHEWSPQILAFQQAIYALLPADWRLEPRLAAPIEEHDPSEAIRSSEIVEQLAIGYDIVGRRDYGGTLLSLLVPKINWDVAPATFDKNLIAAEREWLHCHDQSYYTVAIARPKGGIRGALARVRYYFEPKMRAVRVHAAQAVGKTVRY